MIEAVIFDIDGTMYDYESNNKIAIEALKTYCGENLGLSETAFCDALWEAGRTVEERVGRDCSTRHNRLIRYQCMMENLGIAPFPHGLEMYHIYWRTMLNNMKAYPGLLEFLVYLKGRGVQIGVGSNMTAYIQYRKLEKLGAASYVDWILTSEEAGEQKPAEKFFRLCAEKCRCRPEECLFIGDSLQADVMGALNSGMKALLLTPGGEGRLSETGEYCVIGSYGACMEPGFLERF